jgi:hypothetical protein
VQNYNRKKGNTKAIRRSVKEKDTLAKIYQLSLMFGNFQKHQIITREDFVAYIENFHKEKSNFKQLIKKYLVEVYDSRHINPYDLPDNIADDGFFAFFYSKFEEFDIYSMYLDLEYWFDLLYSVKDSIFKEYDRIIP